jgi:hypothetical protein
MKNLSLRTLAVEEMEQVEGGMKNAWYCALAVIGVVGSGLSGQPEGVLGFGILGDQEC